MATADMSWRVRAQAVSIDRPFVVGILNVTPDSFSDGGEFESVDKALSHAREMLAQGADAIDVGGESTRPQNATPVSAAEELHRVLPLVRALRAAFPDRLLSIDTTKSEVAEAAMNEGANIINDVSGFRLDPRMSEIAARTMAGVVLMHSRGGVAEMATYRHAEYRDVVDEVIGELSESLASAAKAGVDRESIVLDPGIGFAKRSEHSLRILNELPRITALGRPVLVGVSRKRFVGELSGVKQASERIAGTIGANVTALIRGARLFRVHDVAPNRQALDVAWGILQAESRSSAQGASASTSRFGSRFPVPGSRPK